MTDTYTYDAFGNLIEQTGKTPNLYLYAGQQFDPDLGLYYNRARYLDVRNGRFWGMDTYEGASSDPSSLHKYLYAADNAANVTDPSGNFGLDELAAVAAISITLFAISGCNSTPKFVNVKMLAYEQMDYGVHIALVAYTKGRLPHYEKYRWVQWVKTNAIRKRDRGQLQPDVAYLDPPGGDGFYYTDADQAEKNKDFGDGDLNFEDRPQRDPEQNRDVKGTIYWHADLYLVGMTGSGTYDKITHIEYGFKVQNGETTYDDLHITRILP